MSKWKLAIYFITSSFNNIPPILTCRSFLKPFLSTELENSENTLYGDGGPGTSVAARNLTRAVPCKARRRRCDHVLGSLHKMVSEPLNLKVTNGVFNLGVGHSQLGVFDFDLLKTTNILVMN